MNALQVFSYKGSSVTFSNENGMWVNATEMAKPFDKFPYDWLQLQSSKDFLSALVSIRGLNYENRGINYEESSQFIKTVEGRNGGTWFHEDVAIEFARWLSPAFAIWCNDRIKEILTGTMAKYPMSSDEAIAYGYGKALEKISRQSNVIKKQGKRITALLGKLESEALARQQKKLAATRTRDERIMEKVRMMLEASPIIEDTSLCDLHKQFLALFAYDEEFDIGNKVLSAVLRKMDYTPIKKRTGLYFKPCHENC